MCNETVRGLDSLEVEKKAFCAEVMSSNVDDLFFDSNPPIRSQSTNFSNTQRINN